MILLATHGIFDNVPMALLVDQISSNMVAMASVSLSPFPLSPDGSCVRVSEDTEYNCIYYCLSLHSQLLQFVCFNEIGT